MSFASYSYAYYFANGCKFGSLASKNLRNLAKSGVHNITLYLRKAAEKLLQTIKSSHIPQEYIFDQLKRYLK